MTKAEFLYQIALIAHAQGTSGNAYKPYCLPTIANAAIIQAVDPENPRTAEYAVRDTDAVNELFTVGDYAEIEFIYTYHPMIPHTYGKKFIAQMFCMGLLFYNNRKRLLKEAEEAKELDEALDMEIEEETTRKLRSQITELQRSLGAAQRKLHELETELENIA